MLKIRLQTRSIDYGIIHFYYDQSIFLERSTGWRPLFYGIILFLLCIPEEVVIGI